MSDRVNLVAPACPVECLPYLPNVRAIQYKLGPERLARLGNSIVLRLPVLQIGILTFSFFKKRSFRYENDDDRERRTFVNDEPLLTIVNDEPSLTIVNDDPSLMIINDDHFFQKDRYSFSKVQNEWVVFKND